GVDRLRVSSQSLKRTWRTSNVFADACNDYMGDRTKLFGSQIFLRLIEKGTPFKKALAASKHIASVFGKNESPVDLKKTKEEEKSKLHAKLQQKWSARDKENLGIANYSLEELNELEALDISQLAFISVEEKEAAFSLADRVAAGEELG